MKKAVRIVAALAAAVMLAVSCAGCAASSPVYASYGKYGITEAMYEYWLSYYKARFYASLSDYGLTDDGNGSVWDKSPDGGKTLGEQVKDHVDELIRQLLVSSVIYDERGFGEDAETKKLLDDAVDGFLSDEITAAGSRAELDDAVLAALYFSREAAALNPYDAEARYVRAEALAADGQVTEALDLWRPIVEREFWNGANHDEYARLLLLEGSRRSLELAVREKPLVEDPALRRRLERLGKSLEKRRK